MRTVTSVWFDTLERRVLEAVLPSVAIAVPDVYLQREDHPDVRAVRALRAISEGPASFELLERAEGLLAQLVEACVRESDRSHWDRELTPRGASGASSPGAVGLVAPGTDIALVLAGARSSQASLAREALALVRDALAVATPRPDRSEDL